MEPDMATNVTVKIDDELARSAKVYAARHGTSVSRLVAEQLERLVQRDRAYEAAKGRALKRLERASALGWQKPESRDDVHAR
jgi:hypothetical protein